jgi:hypothetical protein
MPSERGERGRRARSQHESEGELSHRSCRSPHPVVRCPPIERGASLVDRGSHRARRRCLARRLGAWVATSTPVDQGPSIDVDDRRLPALARRRRRVRQRGTARRPAQLQRRRVEHRLLIHPPCGRGATRSACNASGAQRPRRLLRSFAARACRRPSNRCRRPGVDGVRREPRSASRLREHDAGALARAVGQVEGGAVARQRHDAPNAVLSAGRRRANARM